MSTVERRELENEESEAVGWVHFAALLVLLIGSFNVVNGIVGLVDDKYFIVTPEGLLVGNYEVWGGVWLGLGVLQVFVAAGIFAGRQWARIVGVALLLLSAVGQIMFLAAFPVWGFLTIGLIVAAIHALTVHGEAFGRGQSAPNRP
jgi:hypothetical protein